jgi:predicted dehydrogenase
MTSSPKTLGVGIIGCGLIGHKRTASLGAPAKVVACAVLEMSRANALADKYLLPSACCGVPSLSQHYCSSVISSFEGLDEHFQHLFHRYN